MYYYQVWVRSNRYHGKELLTYSYESNLKVGSIVGVELQKNQVIGVINSMAETPKFKTKKISVVLDLPPIPSHLLKTADWLREYYPAPLGIIAQQLLSIDLLSKKLDLPEIIDDFNPKTKHLPDLTLEQIEALSKMERTNSYLLHGITGSGKTRIYIELALKAYSKNRSSIILTPEISLTTQLEQSFKNTFGDRVIVLHSKQNPKQHLKSWLICLTATKPVIVIGPRSALFAPIHNPGLIVLDEAHDGAYKQGQAPQYLTSRVAAFIARLSKSSLVLGSATPLINDYFVALQKKKPIIELLSLAIPNKLPKTDILVVDKKDHSLFSRSMLLSQPLLDKMAKALSNNEQILLFLNRRGTARLILCENCGWQATCPHCDIPLIYHGDKHELRCHSCEFHDNVPSNCPNCSHINIVFKTAGTKSIVSEVHKLFPNAAISRFDNDNTKAESFAENYQSVKEGDTDILIGTQTITKGLDLPKLSLVGILLADTSLYLPDFTASERTFQLISQVLGRIGRGHLAGNAVIQTYHPDHPILKFAINNNYSDFYNNELTNRRQYMFPPYCFLLKITIKRAALSTVINASNELKDTINSSKYKVRVEGPAPAFHEKLNAKYQWQLVVKAKDRSEILKLINDLPANTSYDIDPVDLL